MEDDLKNFIEKLNCGKKSQSVNSLEFLINYKKKIEKTINHSNYELFNPFLEKYNGVIGSFIEIYKNPSRENVRFNYEYLRKFLDRKWLNSLDLEKMAEKIIDYSIIRNKEAENIKNDYFMPNYFISNNNLSKNDQEFLEDCFFIESFEKLELLLNQGTFGCVLADALSRDYNDSELKKIHVKEELSRLWNGLDYIYSSINAGLIQKKI